jgi:filamentous hemagglutinin
MSGVRPNRNFSALQVGSLRYDRSSIPANGGMLVVDGQGKLTVASEVSVDKITTSSVIDTPKINAGIATLTTANISTLNASNITITGQTSFDQLVVSGDADICGALVVTDMTVRDELLTNSLEVTGTATFSDTVTINAGLNVDVNELVNVGKIFATEVKADFLDVSGLKVGNNIDVSGNFAVEQTSTFRGPVYFEENIDVSGASVFRSPVTFQNTLDVSGNAHFYDEVTFHNNVVIIGSITDADITDADFIRMDRGYITQLRVGDKDYDPFPTGVALDVSGGASVTGGATVAMGVVVSSGNIVIQSGGVSMAGAATVGNRLNVTGGGASVTGGATVAGGAVVSSGNVVIQDGGALIKYGLQIDNSGAIIADGITVTNGGATIVGGLIVYDNTSLKGNLDISGNMTVITRNKAIIRNPSTAGASSLPILSIDASGHEIMFVGNMSNEAYNKITKLGDKGIIFRDRDSTPASSGNLVIAPHSNSIGGIRITADSKVGINKQLPTVELDVSGAIQASGRITVGGGLVVTSGGASITGGATVSSGNINIVNGIVSTQRVALTQDGNSSTPAIYWANSVTSEFGNDTGFSHPADGQISVITNSSERMRVTPGGVTVSGDISTSGKVSTDSLELKNNGTLTNPAIYWTGNGGTDTGINHSDGQISIITNQNERLRVNDTTVSVFSNNVSSNNPSFVSNRGSNSVNILNYAASDDAYNSITQIGDNVLYSDMNHNFVVAKHNGAGLRITDTDVAVNGRLSIQQTGTAANPTIYNPNLGNSGIYFVGNNDIDAQVAVSVSGNNALRCTTTGVIMDKPFIVTPILSGKRYVSGNQTITFSLPNLTSGVYQLSATSVDLAGAYRTDRWAWRTTVYRMRVDNNAFNNYALARHLDVYESNTSFYISDTSNQAILVVSNHLGTASTYHLSIVYTGPANDLNIYTNNI